MTMCVLPLLIYSQGVTTADESAYLTWLRLFTGCNPPWDLGLLQGFQCVNNVLTTTLLYGNALMIAYS